MFKKLALSTAAVLASFMLLFPLGVSADGKSQGDLDNNGKVDIIDLSTLLSNYGTTNTLADANGNGTVDIIDLSIVLSNYGKTIAATAPTVSLSSPVNNSTISGTQTITANASDAKGIASVQFQLDGANLGSPVTVSPYSVTWDTTKVANGSHTLTAVATNTSNLSTTATSVTVNVQNTVTPPVSPNLIPNSSLETAQDVNTPQGWSATSWGTNTSVFSYLNTGHTGSRSLKAETTAYTNGAANWVYADVPVTAGKTYQYQNWYQSNVDTEVDAEVQMTNGTTQFIWLGNVLTSPTWNKFTATFTPPAGAKSIAIYQLLAKTGFIVTDDYSLNEYTPTGFSRPLVSITYDDGWANQYANAFPLQQQYGLPATFYIISGELTDQPDYMSATQVTLQGVVGLPVTDFAYPFGAYNANTIAVGKQYYQSQRTVIDGLNTKDSFDITQLKIHEVDSNITTAQVQAWIDQAIADKGWLILVYHETATSPVDPTDALYTTKPADLNTELAYIKSTNVAVVTVNQALNELTPQISQ
jgi:hypothetical protein